MAAELRIVTPHEPLTERQALERLCTDVHDLMQGLYVECPSGIFAKMSRTTTWRNVHRSMNEAYRTLRGLPFGDKDSPCQTK